MRAGVESLTAVLLATVSAVHAAPDSQLVVSARPDAGFNYPYILRLPSSPDTSFAVILVETNNTGAPADDSDVHMSSALELSRNGLGGKVADELRVPLLMPVFPRPRDASLVYTHALDRETLELTQGPMRRLDLQLIAMIQDAKQSLARKGMHYDERVLLTGFSASAKFANRFTALHPGHVRAVATGGMNGIAILPLANFDNRPVPYPLGVGDLSSLAGSAFERDAWRGVAQLLFMGADDTNDAVAFDDAYSEQERTWVYEVLGRQMVPARWDRCRDIYADAGADARFITYAGVGHGTSGAIRRDVAEFFRSVLARPVRNAT